VDLKIMEKKVMRKEMKMKKKDPLRLFPYLSPSSHPSDFPCSFPFCSLSLSPHAMKSLCAMKCEMMMMMGDDGRLVFK
jgi:hypothetical protein